MKTRNHIAILLIFAINSLNANNYIKRDTVLTLEFPQLPPTMYSMVLENYAVPRASVFLPADYSIDKKFPVLLWIVGGMGSTGNGARALAETYGNTGFIFINLPQFKNHLEPLLPDSSNYWHRLMLYYEPEHSAEQELKLKLFL